MGGCAVPSTTPFILLHPHVRCDETFVRGMFDDAHMARQLPSTANNIRSACVVSVVILGSWMGRSSVASHPGQSVLHH